MNKSLLLCDVWTSERRSRNARYRVISPVADAGGMTAECVETDAEDRVYDLNGFGAPAYKILYTKETTFVSFLSII